ncbi:MAG: carboxypeptidase regulatory-like domain-containing protein [Deltaproteobacteria bacterium]|nr:carboxypeptidase regulatory-like domain-containing protein [Deltaproteobacteria bacterium]
MKIGTGQNAYIFRKSPDSVRPGNLQGPFTGTVYDSATKKALSGAKVRAYYVFSGHGRSERVVTKTVKTLSNGEFEIPALIHFPVWSPGLELTGVQLVVAFPGYYHSSSSNWGNVSINGAWTQNFTQLENFVLLQKSSMAENRSRAIDMLTHGNLGGDSSFVYYKAASEITKKSPINLTAGNLLNISYVQNAIRDSSFPLITERVSTPDESAWELLFDNGNRVSWKVWAVSETQTSEIAKGLISALDDKKKTVIFGKTVNTGTSEGYRISIAQSSESGHIITIGCQLRLCSNTVINSLMRHALKRLTSGLKKGAVQLTDGMDFTDNSTDETFPERFVRLFMNRKLHEFIKSVFQMELGVFENISVSNSPWLVSRISASGLKMNGIEMTSGKMRLISLALAGALYTRYHPGSLAVTTEHLTKLFRMAIKGTTALTRETYMGIAFFHLGAYASMPSSMNTPNNLINSFISNGLKHKKTGEIWVEYSNKVRKPITGDADNFVNKKGVRSLLIIPDGSIYFIRVPLKNGKLEFKGLPDFVRQTFKSR